MFLDEPPNFPKLDSTSKLSDSLAESVPATINRELYKSKKYIPVALVLITECEYHDTFREILLALFDMLRVLPDKKET